MSIDAIGGLLCDPRKTTRNDGGERPGGTETMPKFPNRSGTAERELALSQSHREDGVFDVLMEVLEETPEALSL